MGETGGCQFFLECGGSVRNKWFGLVDEASVFESFQACSKGFPVFPPLLLRAFSKDGGLWPLPGSCFLDDLH